MKDQFLFRSKERKVTEAEIGKGEEFANWLLSQHGVYFSDTDMAWIGAEGNIESPLRQESFADIRSVFGK